MARVRANKSALLAAALGLATLGAATLAQHDLIIFNHSPSIPVGFYVRADADAGPGSIVTVRARDVAPLEASRRNFVGDRDRFLKRVAAIGGDEVCGDGRELRVEGRAIATILDDTERATPSGWIGCRRLEHDEILLLGDSADSFDGRYWGPISTRLIEGVWRPL
jgi:type IV secretory pathway protease TraF